MYAFFIIIFCFYRDEYYLINQAKVPRKISTLKDISEGCLLHLFPKNMYIIIYEITSKDITFRKGSSPDKFLANGA